MSIPIIGTPPENVVIVPIDLKLLPELREKMAADKDANQQAGEAGQVLLKILARALPVGVAAHNADVALNEFVAKLLQLHSVPPEKFLGFDLEKGQIKVKP